MQLLEHRAKQLAATAGIPVPEGRVVTTTAGAERVARALGGQLAVKAQIPAGGRGKSGGVHRVGSPTEARRSAEHLLGQRLAGHRVDAVLVERFVPSAQEMYLAITIDTAARTASLLFGPHGGTDVEQRPWQVSAVAVPQLSGLREWHVWDAVHGSGDPLPAPVGRLVAVARAAYGLFAEQRAALVELNPLLVTSGGDLVAADVRVVPEAGGGEPVPGDRSARVAKEHGFDFVTLDAGGDVGLVSTGAGGSLLLVDLLVDAGARPVNFCDIRSGGFRGRPDRLICAFRELHRFRRLRCVVVNVFAGITDIVDFGRLLVRAVKVEPPRVPLVARVEGGRADEARLVLREAGIACVDSLDGLVTCASEVARQGAGQ